VEHSLNRTKGALVFASNLPNRWHDHDTRRRSRNIYALSLLMLALMAAVIAVSSDEPWTRSTSSLLGAYVVVVLAIWVLVWRRRASLAALLLVGMSALGALASGAMGGLGGPWFVLLAPLLLASVTLPLRRVAILGGLVVAAAVTLVLWPSPIQAFMPADVVQFGLVVVFVALAAIVNTATTERALSMLEQAWQSSAADMATGAAHRPPTTSQPEPPAPPAATWQGAAPQRENALIHLSHMVAVAANEASSLDEAVRTSLQRICEHTGWLAGHVYFSAEEGNGEFQPTSIWHIGYPERFEVVPTRVELGRFAAGLRLQAEVISTRAPHWITNIADEDDLSRHLAARLGIHSAFAVPVKAGGSVVAVLEFFSDMPIVPDRPLLDIFAHVSAQLGRVAERARSAEAIRRSEEALQEANHGLLTMVRELEERTREITLLNEMGEKLNECHTAEEAYAVVEQAAARIFGGEPGGLWIQTKDEALFEAVALWGDAPPTQRAMSEHECWALQRGKVHRLGDAELGLMCQHVGHNVMTATICVPLVAQGKKFGLFYLGLDAPLADEPDTLQEPVQHWSKDAIRSKQRLAVTVAEHVALSLANLRLQATLRLQAIRDPLTDLYNRRFMEEALRREIHRSTRTGNHLSVVMLDLDYFKRFNDTFGHPAGDTLLKAVARVIQLQVRGEDTACRYGGEEFALILPNSGLDDARRCAERIRDEVRRLHVEHRGQSLGQVTLSVGVATFPTHGASGAAILQSADAALYEAKRAGRDRVFVGELVS
jgi:diguanylate cyclase (GGDEF)-like protein